MDTLHNWGAGDALARKLKERKRMAMQARRNHSTGRFVPAVVEVPVDVFETASGVLAYRKRMPNLTHLGALWTDKASGVDVTLPWVSILGRTA